MDGYPTRGRFTEWIGQLAPAFDSGYRRKCGLARIKVIITSAGESDGSSRLLVQNFKVDDTRIKTVGQGRSADANAAGGGVEIRICRAGTNPADTSSKTLAKRAVGLDQHGRTSQFASFKRLFCSPERANAD